MNQNHNSKFLRGAVATLALALAAALFPGADETALAGSCSETTTSGTWTCEGAADTSADTAQTLTADTSERLVVTTAPGFGIGNSIILNAASGSLGIDATIGGPVTSTRSNVIGVSANHQGGGAAAITVGSVNTMGIGIDVQTTSATTGGVNVNATGDVFARGMGININHRGGGAVVINSRSINAAPDGISVRTTSAASSATVNVSGDISSDARGIDINHQGAGALAVSVSGSVRAVATGINAVTSSTVSGLTINATGDITGNDGIGANHQGTGSVVINSGGVNAESIGINVATTASADGVTVNSTGDIFARNVNINTRGININHRGTGAVAVHSSGGINSGGRAISVETTSAATGGVTVNSTGNLSTDGFAININHQGAGAVVINSGGINSRATGINVATASTVSGVTVNATGDITSREVRGININHQGAGSVVINTSGNVNAADGGGTDTGINVVTASPADALTINATGDITSAGSRAINATHLGTGELSIFLAPDADITAINDLGIYAAANTAGRSGNPAGGMNIMVMGDIGSAASPASGGISAEHHTGGDLNITVGGVIDTTGPSTGRGVDAKTVDAKTGADSSAVNINVTGSIRTSTEGITLAHQGAGDVNINIAPGASVSAGGSSRAIVAGTSGSAARHSDIILDIAGTVSVRSVVAVEATSSNGVLVRLRPGANVTGLISPTSPNSVFEFAPAAAPFADTTSFDLSQLDGFDSILKTGPETWELTGRVTADSLSLDNGVLILDEDARVTTANYAGNGGRLVMSANFAGGFSSPDESSWLRITGDLTGATPPVELRIYGNPPADASIPEIISVDGPDEPNAATHFTGSADSGLYAFILDCTTVGECSFVRSGFGDAGGVIESYAATLAELSSLPSMRRRLEGRVRSEEEAGEKEDIGVWGRIEGAFASFEPGVSATNSEYEIQDTRIRFGADYPLEDIGLTLGGNLWFGLSNTDISTGGGKIETTGYAAAISAAFERNDFYADGQFQFALFSSDLSASGFPASGSDATAFSVSGEAGYSFPLSGFNVIPQAQVIWVSADFDDINIGGGQTASLGDGAALTGRVGVFADKEFKGSEGEYGDAGKGNVYAGLNLLVPLDGETAARVGAETLTSELEAVAGELNVGGSYAWGEKRGVFGEAAVSLGSEVTEYRANVGLRFGF